MDSWAKYAPNRHLEASSTYDHAGHHVAIGNHSEGLEALWSTGAVELEKGLYTSSSGVDPVMTITLQVAKN